jgi:hypothetical protein
MQIIATCSFSSSLAGQFDFRCLPIDIFTFLILELLNEELVFLTANRVRNWNKYVWLMVYARLLFVTPLFLQRAERAIALSALYYFYMLLKAYTCFISCCVPGCLCGSNNLEVQVQLLKIIQNPTNQWCLSKCHIYDIESFRTYRDFFDEYRVISSFAIFTCMYMQICFSFCF